MKSLAIPTRTVSKLTDRRSREEARAASQSTQAQASRQAWKKPAARARCGTGTRTSTASPSTSPSGAPQMGRRCSSSTASRSSGSRGATRWPRSPPKGSARSPPTSAATATPPRPPTPPPTPSSTSSATSSRSLTTSSSSKVFVVGHDWGAQVAWHLCLFRPDRVRAVVALGVPYFGRNPVSMTEVFAALGDVFYITQFQEPGRAERAFARYDVATVLKKFFSIQIDDLTAPPGVEIIDFLEASPSPLPWISEEEIGQYAEKFKKSGFTGPINYYRMADMNWRLLAPWHGAKITVPAKFIAGDKDIGVRSFGIEQYIKSRAFKSIVPDLEVTIIEGHHFLQQEQAERVNSEIISYLVNFTSEDASA